MWGRSMPDEADAERIAEAAVQRHRDEVARETAASDGHTQESLIREMWGELKVIVRVQGDQLTEAVKTNHRIGSLEVWRDRIIGGVVLALAGSPLLVFELRQWIADVVGG